MQVGHDVAQQHVVHMARLENSLDDSPDILNVPPVVGELVGRQPGEVSDVPTTEDNGRVTVRDRVPLENRLAGAAAVE